MNSSRQEELLECAISKDLWDYHHADWVIKLIETPTTSPTRTRHFSETVESKEKPIQSRIRTLSCDLSLDFENDLFAQPIPEAAANVLIPQLMDLQIYPPRGCKRTYSSSSSNSEGNECGYCLKSSISDYVGHSKKNCPRLAKLPPCFICGAFGKENHTATYCPQRKTTLELKTEFHRRWILRQVNQGFQQD